MSKYIGGEGGTLDQEAAKTKIGISAPRPPRYLILVSKLRPNGNKSYLIEYKMKFWPIYFLKN